MSKTHEAFTMSDLFHYAAVVETCETNAKVARAIDGDIHFGIARNVCRDESGAFLGATQDIREGILHVTSRGGFEFFWPLSELAAEHARGEFAQYNWD